jgi:flagellar hook-associated protein 3 FlgL
MRITTNFMTKSYLSDLNTNLENMTKLERQLSTGSAVEGSSGDPFKVYRTMQLSTSISSNNRYLENIEDAKTWANSTDTSLGEMGDVMQRVRELTLQSGDGSYDKTQLYSIQTEVEQLKDELMQIGNTEIDGRYIFGGDSTINIPFSNNNGFIMYNGSNKGLSKELSQGVNIDIAAVGNEFSIDSSNEGNMNSLFANNTAVIKSEVSSGDIAISGAYDISKGNNSIHMEVLSVVNKEASSVRVTITNSDGTSTINTMTPQNGELDLTSQLGIKISIGDSMDNKAGNTYDFDVKPSVMDEITNNLKNGKDATEFIGQVDNKIDKLLTMRADCGAIQNRLDTMKSKNEDQSLNLKELLSKTSEVDIVEAYIQYSTLKNVYTASLKTGAGIIQPSLLDYLG